MTGTRGERTKAAILDSALRLFREQGYDATTMRAIAQDAGVSPGNAYYYFAGKDELVQEFYAGIQREHRVRAAAALAASDDLGARLRGVLRAGVAVLAPYHEFAGAFVKVAIVPGAPASPFSAESAPSRDTAVALFAETVDGSDTTVDSALRAELPELLWLAYLGVTLYWVYDTSPGQRRTRQLVDMAAPLLAKLIRAARLPVLRSMTGELLAGYRKLRP